MDIRLTIGGIVALVVIGIILSGYVKASPDEAILISGLKKEAKIVIGTAAIKIPFLERKDRLPLKTIKIDVKTQESVPTQEFINVNVDAVVTVKVSSKRELLKIAAENFLNQDVTYIEDMVKDVLEGNIREIVGTMSLENMISNRKEFATKVEENAVPDMEKMGIEIVSFNVQNFTDNHGVINDLGIDNTERIKKNAAIVKAEAQRDVKIAQAMADKQANDAQVASDQEIAIKKNELAIRKSELKKMEDSKSAEADAAYEIQKEEQRKEIEIKTADANLAKQEKEIIIKEREVIIQERTLEASIRKKAEADRFARQEQAEAQLYERQKEAEAEKFEAIQEAEALKAKAGAEREAREQEAIGLRALALAEADGIRAKGLAEAEGIEKKAQAMKLMEEAAVLEMYFKVLPEVAANVAKPLENIDKITMYGEGNAAKMVGDITRATTQITEGLTEGLGIDVKSMLTGFLGGKMAKSDQTIITTEIQRESEKGLNEKSTNEAAATEGE